MGVVGLEWVAAMVTVQKKMISASKHEAVCREIQTHFGTFAFQAS